MEVFCYQASERSDLQSVSILDFILNTAGNLELISSLDLLTPSSQFSYLTGSSFVISFAAFLTSTITSHCSQNLFLRSFHTH